MGRLCGLEECARKVKSGKFFCSKAHYVEAVRRHYQPKKSLEAFITLMSDNDAIIEIAEQIYRWECGRSRINYKSWNELSDEQKKDWINSIFGLIEWAMKSYKMIKKVKP